MKKPNLPIWFKKFFTPQTLTRSELIEEETETLMREVEERQRRAAEELFVRLESLRNQRRR